MNNLERFLSDQQNHNLDWIGLEQNSLSPHVKLEPFANKSNNRQAPFFVVTLSPGANECCGIFFMTVLNSFNSHLICKIKFVVAILLTIRRQGR